jgi:hypothetical protein
LRGKSVSPKNPGAWTSENIPGSHGRNSRVIESYDQRAALAQPAVTWLAQSLRTETGPTSDVSTTLRQRTSGGSDCGLTPAEILAQALPACRKVLSAGAW